MSSRSSHGVSKRGPPSRKTSASVRTTRQASSASRRSPTGAGRPGQRGAPPPRHAARAWSRA
jgi:hypothetical protein